MLVKDFFGEQKFDVKFFYLGFLSRKFTIHRTVGEGGGYLFNSFVTLLPASFTNLDTCQVISTESSTPHIASSRTRTENLWFTNENW